MAIAGDVATSESDDRTGVGLSAGQIAAILHAQFRSLIHFASRGKVGTVFVGIMSLAWYGLVVAGSVMVSYVLAFASPREIVRGVAAGALFVVFYWQFIPLMVVSAGAGLDLKRLVVYPLTRAQLFMLELLLRFTTGMEALVLMIGAAFGLWRNPNVGWWVPLGFVPFLVMNLGMASGLRALVGRWMSARRTREITMLILVMVATVPQLIFSTSMARRAGFGGGWLALPGSPWWLLGTWVAGRGNALTMLGLIGWAGLACLFGWWQFGCTLSWDETAARARGGSDDADHPSLWRRITEAAFTWPGALFAEPIGALVEKELRSLVRTPRFRVVFFMGFTFSFVWFLVLTRRGGEAPENVLAILYGYSLLLLGETCFWNVLGFDRGAAQFYFLAPQPFRRVLMAKNITSGVVVVAEFVCITAVALVLRLPVNLERWAEAMGAGLLVALLLMSAGNVASIRAPRSADPSDVWRRASAGKSQALVLFLSPLLAAPALLAYLAKYAFDSEIAFWAVLVVMVAVGVAGYLVALDSAVGAAEVRRESITEVLSRGSGPISS